MRHARAADRENPLYARHPEAWLESQVRANYGTDRRHASSAAHFWTGSSIRRG